MIMKKKYSVRLYFHTHVDVEVVAENTKDAIEEAYCKSGTNEFSDSFQMNAETDNEPDVTLIEED